MYFFPAGAILYAGETAIIAREGDTFENLYGLKPDYKVTDTDPTIPNMSKDSDWVGGSMNLRASGDEVLLLDDRDNLVDGVSWGASNIFLDPSVPNVDPDHSIERFPAEVDSDTAGDWQSNPIHYPGKLFSAPSRLPLLPQTRVPPLLPPRQRLLKHLHRSRL
jgi:hypothetical protein